VSKGVSPETQAILNQVIVFKLDANDRGLDEDTKVIVLPGGET